MTNSGPLWTRKGEKVVEFEFIGESLGEGRGRVVSDRLRRIDLRLGEQIHSPTHQTNLRGVRV